MKKLRYVLTLVSLFFCFSLWAEENLDAYLHQKGMVDVGMMDTTLRIELIYATPDNFLGKAVYSGITRPWLHPKAAEMLIKAQRLLKEKKPTWNLLIYDAARPMSVQRKMWALVRGTNKVNYVSNPAHGGGLHNYGMAVDLTIVDEFGTPLPMGTSFDFFGEEAHTTHEETLLQNGKLTRQEFENRRFLRRIMQQAGFRVIPYEWWHFNACSRTEARKSYNVLD